MVNIIQISDLHYGSEFVPEYMENVIQYIEEIRPDAVICTGDIVHKGRVVQFRKFLPYLDRIKELSNFLAVP
ncbi:MAG: metallophosphoesterase family protein, partial [Promethearchaeota archaeon]